MLNECKLIGGVGKDPELTNLADGLKVCRFSLATSEYRKDGTQITYWHNVVVWAKLADIVGQVIRQGDRVFVSGKLTSREYEKDGVKRFAYEISANQVHKLQRFEKKPDEAKQPHYQDTERF